MPIELAAQDMAGRDDGWPADRNCACCSCLFSQICPIRRPARQRRKSAFVLRVSRQGARERNYACADPSVFPVPAALPDAGMDVLLLDARCRPDGDFRRDRLVRQVRRQVSWRCQHLSMIKSSGIKSSGSSPRPVPPPVDSGDDRHAALFLLHRALVPQAHQVSVGVGELDPVSPEGFAWAVRERDAPCGPHSAKVASTSGTWNHMAHPFGLMGDEDSCRNSANPSLSCSAIVPRSGTSNSTFNPSVATYQSRERFVSVTGMLRWSNFIIVRYLRAWSPVWRCQRGRAAGVAAAFTP